MNENFQEGFMKLLTDAVSICYDNVKDVDGVEKIFLLLWNENTIRSAMYRYKINGTEKNNSEPSERAKSLAPQTMRELNEITSKLGAHFEENEQPKPTVYKVIFDAKTTQMKLKMEYDNIEEQTGEPISVYYDEWVKQAIKEPLEMN